MKDKLELIEVYTADEDWERAKDISKEIEEDWDKKKFFIMCNYGESEFEGLEGHINDILGGVEAEDVGAALPTILSAQDAWENLNKIIPAPQKGVSRRDGIYHKSYCNVFDNMDRNKNDWKKINF